MATSRGFGIADFQRAFDEFFDEMLIDRWKRGTPAPEFERAQVIDHRDRYEVRVAAVGVDPAKIEAEVSGQRLAVRAPLRPLPIWLTRATSSLPTPAPR